MDWSILLGIGIGLSLAAPPGPMNALIANQAAKSGWLSGVKVGVAAPVADTIYLAIFGLGIGAFLDTPTILGPLAILGAALLLLFAWQAFHANDDAKPVAGMGKAFAVAMTNPYQLGWWLSAGVVFAQNQGTLWVIGFLSGIFGWVVVFSYLIAHGAKRWQWFPQTVRIVSSAVLVFGAGALLWFVWGLL